MAGVEQRVERGVISFEQAERLDHEPGPDRPGGPRTIEVVGYLAAMALLIATIAAVVKVAFPADPFFGFFFGEFENVPGGLVALAGAAITFGTGYRFATGPGAVGRAAGFSMLIGYLLANFGVLLLLFELDLGDATPLAVTLPSALVAFVGWRRFRCVPTQIALFLAAVGLVSAILVLIQVEEILDPAGVAFSLALGGAADFGSWISQLVSVALGVAWVWFGHTGVLGPRNAAFFIGSLYSVLFGLALFASADGWVILSAGLVGAYAWAATQWRTSMLGAAAALGGIVLVLQVMSLVHDEPGTTEFMLWFGIPGILALAAIWGLAPGVVASSPAATPTPPPPAAPTNDSDE